MECARTMVSWTRVKVKNKEKDALCLTEQRRGGIAVDPHVIPRDLGFVVYRASAMQDGRAPRYAVSSHYKGPDL